MDYEKELNTLRLIKREIDKKSNLVKEIYQTFGEYFPKKVGEWNKCDFEFALSNYKMMIQLTSLIDLYLIISTRDNKEPLKNKKILEKVLFHTEKNNRIFSTK